MKNSFRPQYLSMLQTFLPFVVTSLLVYALNEGDSNERKDRNVTDSGSWIAYPPLESVTPVNFSPIRSAHSHGGI